MKSQSSKEATSDKPLNYEESQVKWIEMLGFGEQETPINTREFLS